MNFKTNSYVKPRRGQPWAAVRRILDFMTHVGESKGWKVSAALSLPRQERQARPLTTSSPRERCHRAISTMRCQSLRNTAALQNGGLVRGKREVVMFSLKTTPKKLS